MSDMIDRALLEMTSERTDEGYQIRATMTLDPRDVEAIRRWAENEALAGRFYTLKNLSA